MLHSMSEVLLEIRMRRDGHQILVYALPQALCKTAGNNRWCVCNHLNRR